MRMLKPPNFIVILLFFSIVYFIYERICATSDAFYDRGKRVKVIQRNIATWNRWSPVVAQPESFCNLNLNLLKVFSYMSLKTDSEINYLDTLSFTLQRTTHSKAHTTLGLSSFTKSLYANQNERNDLPSVVVIGAGMAGISAADTLLNNGITNVQILEATDRYGGRIYSKKWHKGLCELGVKCVNFPFDESVLPVYGEVGIDSDSYPDYNFFKSDGKLIDQKISKCVRKEFAKLRNSFDDMRLIINASEASDDNITKIVQNVQKQCRFAKQEDVSCVINAVLNTMRGRFGTDLQNVNLDLCKHKIVTNKKIELPFGCLSFFNLLTAPKIMDSISFGSPVGNIKRMYEFPERFIRTETLNGKTYDSDYVICTIPLSALSALGNSMFDPPLSKDKQKAMQMVGVGNVERIFLYFEKLVDDWFQGPVNFAWLPNELMSRNHWSTGTCTVNKLPSSNKILEITVAGFQAEDICLVSDEKAMLDVHSTLQKFLGNSNIPYPLDILRSKWSKDICSLGSIVYPKENATMDDLMIQEETADFDYPDYPRLLFAGDATICDYFGTIHGARLSGIREANRIIESVRDGTFKRSYIN